MAKENADHANDHNAGAADVITQIKLFRLENLLERRPFLLSDAHLRQNSNNVKEWLKRVDLCCDKTDMIIDTYEKAIKTVDPLKAIGK